MFLWVLRVIASILVFFTPIYLLWSIRASFGQISDLPEFFATAQMLASGKGLLIYDLSQQTFWQHLLFPALGNRYIPIYLPPFAILWLLPLSWLPTATAPLIWTSFLFICLVVATFILCKLFRLGLIGILIIWIAMSLSGPGFDALRLGQLAPILLLALSFFLFFIKHNHPLLAGFALSTLLLKPPELLPILAYLAGAGQFQTCGIVTLVLLISIVVSLYFWGGQIYNNYFGLLVASAKNYNLAQLMSPQLCPTLRGQLLKLYPNISTEVTLISTVICVGMLGFIVWYGRKLSKKSCWLEYGLISAFPLGLITALHCHTYDMTLLIPGTVACFRSQLWNSLKLPIRLLIVSGFLIFFHPIYTTVHYEYLLHDGKFNLFFWFLLILSLYLTVLVIRKPDRVE